MSMDIQTDCPKQGEAEGRLWEDCLLNISKRVISSSTKMI